jgi:hypothetical protein
MDHFYDEEDRKSYKTPEMCLSSLSEKAPKFEIKSDPEAMIINRMLNNEITTRQAAEEIGRLRFKERVVEAGIMLAALSLVGFAIYGIVRLIWG